MTHAHLPTCCSLHIFYFMCFLLLEMPSHLLSAGMLPEGTSATPSRSLPLPQGSPFLSHNNHLACAACHAQSAFAPRGCWSLLQHMYFVSLPLLTGRVLRGATTSPWAPSLPCVCHDPDASTTERIGRNPCTTGLVKRKAGNVQGSCSGPYTQWGSYTQ